MTDRVDAIRNITGLMTVGGGTAVGADRLGMMDTLSQNAIAIGALCTMITCTVFVITGIYGMYLKHKQTDRYIDREIEKRLGGTKEI